MTKYIDMTAAERQAAYNDLAYAYEIHADAFTLRPSGFGNRRCAAYRDFERVEREMGFLMRVSRSRGDAWAKVAA